MNCEAILKYIPGPKKLEGTPQLQITTIDYSSYIGRIAVGRVARGSLKSGQPITLVKRDGYNAKSKVKELYTFDGLE